MTKTDLVMGIEVGGTNVSVAIANREGIITDSVVKENVDYTSDDKFTEQVLDARISSLSRLGLSESDILFHGIGAAGQPTLDKRIVGAANCPFPQTFPQVLASLGRGVVIRNDVATAAYAAKGFGYGFSKFGSQGQPRFDAAMVIGTGTNVQILMNGELIASAEGRAAESGHVDLNGEGDKLDCNCGADRCAETYIAGSGIARRVGLMLAKQDKNSSNSNILKAMKVDFRDESDGNLISILLSGRSAQYVSNAADPWNSDRDTIAVDVMTQASRNLARYFGNLINSLGFLPYLEVYGGVAENHPWYVENAVRLLQNDNSLRRNYKFDQIPFIAVTKVKNLGLQGTVSMAFHELDKSRK